MDTLASEDQLNQLLGVTADNSETAILADLTTNPGPPLPTGDVLPAVGAPGFDADLTTIANGNFTDAVGDFEGYLQYLATDLGSTTTGGLSDLSSLLSELGSLF